MKNGAYSRRRAGRKAANGLFLVISGNISQAQVHVIRNIFKILFWSLVTWLFFRAFIFQAFRIPSASMHGSLFEGDYVVINKLAYGPRLPVTPLAISLNGSKKYLDWVSLPPYHLFGYSSIRRNDIVAFNFDLLNDKPIDMQEEFIKRCVALPGDTLRIKEGRVFANNGMVENGSVYNTYYINSSLAPDTAQLKQAGIFVSGTAGNGEFTACMRAATADSLSKLKHIKSIRMDAFSPDSYSPSVYPHSSEFRWNYDYFGPLWIPKKGDSVLLSRPALILYQHCIEAYEKETFAFKNDSVFVSGRYAQYYCFKQDYYFLLGDNRHNSVDSRAMGLIPKDHIIGKASFILYSSAKSSRRFLTIH